LIRRLGLRNSGEVQTIVGKYYEQKRIPAKTQYFVEEICNELSTSPDLE
jgi:hypothetical protein